MAIVTVSRQPRSLGDEIAEAVAGKLGYEFLGKKKIIEAMEIQGLPAPEFEKFDGKKPTIWQSMFDQKKKFIFLLRAAIYDFASRGDVVILGRGGQALLKGIPGTLHVRVVAPLANRVQRLAALEGHDGKRAEQLVLQLDRDSSAYIRSFFDIDWGDATHYDLLLNTRTMSVQTAVGLIQEAIAAPDFEHGSKETATNLEDMALEQKVRGVLVGAPGISLSNVETTQGIVVLTGLAGSQASVAECKNLVAQIEGVREVQAKLEYVPIRSV